MISIIIPTYNNPEEVDNLLATISSSSGISFPFEAIVVDDGSADYSIKEAVKPFGFARYIRLEKNSGAAVARNRGAREARFGTLLFFDSDVAIFSDTLSKAKKHFDDDKIEAFVGHLDDVPLNKGFFPRFKAIMFNSWLPKDGFSTVFTPAVGGIRKDTFFECGGFDETIKGATVEYVKFSYELRKTCMIYFFPDFVVRVKINSFKKALYTDYCSTMKWVTIFSRYKKFDNHCTTVSGGMGRIFGFASITLLPPCIIYGLYPAWAMIFAAYCYLNIDFFMLILKKESPIFLVRGIITHMLLSVSTVAGGAAGAMIVIKNALFGGQKIKRMTEA